MRVLGCDCSSKLIGCVMLDVDDYFYAEVLLADSKDMNTRSEQLFVKFGEFLDDLILNNLRPEAVYLEQAIYMKNVKTTLAIDAVINAARFNCLIRDIPYFLVDNKHWKKMILGNGKATKEEIMKHCKLMWGDKITTQDIADASAIALYGAKNLLVDA